VARQAPDDRRAVPAAASKGAVMHIIGIIVFAIVMAFLIEKWLDDRNERPFWKRDDWD
jgi:hypothetical protein